MNRTETLRVLERAVDAEALRQKVRAGVRQNGQHLTAILVGVPRAVVRKVLAMSNPQPATLKRLQEWAMDRPDPEVTPGLAALAVLASEFQSPRRARARADLAQALIAMHMAQGAPPPEWLIEECLANPPRAE